MAPKRTRKPRQPYVDALDALAELLRKRPMTAIEVAAAFKCCRPVAYERLRALKKRGVKLVTSLPPRSTGSQPGPRATRYAIS